MNCIKNIFCITTDHRKKEYRRAVKQFKKIGFKGEIIKFNASQIDLLHFKATKPQGETRHIGTGLCHLEIVKRAKKEQMKSVVIFEDDVVFYKWDNDKFKNAYNALLKAAWDIFYIGYNFKDDHLQCDKVSENLIKIKKNPSVEFPKKLTKTQLNQLYPDIRSTHAYIINNTAYNKIIREYDPYKSPVHVDNWLPKKLENIYCLVPLMCTQDGKKKIKFLKNYDKYGFENK